MRARSWVAEDCPPDVRKHEDLPARRTDALASTWVKVGGERGFGHLGFVGLYQYRLAVHQWERYVVQCIVSGKGQEVRLQAAGFEKLTPARRHFRFLAKSLSSDQWTRRVLCRPTVKKDAA